MHSDITREDELATFAFGLEQYFKRCRWQVSDRQYECLESWCLSDRNLGRGSIQANICVCLVTPRTLQSAPPLKHPTKPRYKVCYLLYYIRVTTDARCRHACNDHGPICRVPGPSEAHSHHYPYGPDNGEPCRPPSSLSHPHSLLSTHILAFSLLPLLSPLPLPFSFSFCRSPRT